MKDENRCIVTKLEIFDNELVAIHALEIIDNIITGIYFHGYLKKDIYINIMICIIYQNFNLVKIIYKIL